MGDDTSTETTQVDPTPTIAVATDEVVLAAPGDAPDLDPTAPATDYVPGHALLAPVAAANQAPVAFGEQPAAADAPDSSTASEKSPVEGKVWSSTVGAGAGSALATLLLWLFAVLVWHAPATADAAVQAVAAVPGPVSAVVGVGVPSLVAFVSGYVAKHTARPSTSGAP